MKHTTTTTGMMSSRIASISPKSAFYSCAATLVNMQQVNGSSLQNYTIVIEVAELILRFRVSYAASFS